MHSPPFASSMVPLHTGAKILSAARIRIAGTAQFDPYAKQLGVLVNTIVEMPEEKKAARTDNAKIKRVELHMHTQM